MNVLPVKMPNKPHEVTQSDIDFVKKIKKMQIGGLGGKTDLKILLFHLGVMHANMSSMENVTELVDMGFSLEKVTRFLELTKDMVSCIRK